MVHSWHLITHSVIPVTWVYVFALADINAKDNTVGTSWGFLFYHSVQRLSKSLQGVSQATALQGRSFAREEIAEGECDGEGCSAGQAGWGRVEVLRVNDDIPLPSLFVFSIGTPTVVQDVQIPHTASDIEADLYQTVRYTLILKGDYWSQ